jgi:rhodanese-related sulfurtransferase
LTKPQPAVTGVSQIERDELRRMLEDGSPLVLVDALPPMSFARSRLPGAVNMPPDRVDELAPRLIPETQAEIVVYCAGPTCETSEETARRLVELGCANVRRYVGGKQDWIEAGLPVESGRARASR